MSEQVETREVEFPVELYNSIQAIIERYKWMGFASADDFIEDAVRRRFEELFQLGLLKRRAEKK